MLHLVLFDLDGTLINTIDDIHDSLNLTLKEFNAPLVHIDQTKSYVGDGMKKLLERAAGDLFSDKMLLYFREIYKKHIVNKTTPYNGINHIFEYLNKHRISSAVISNKAYNLTNTIVNHFGLNKYLNGCFGGDSFPEKKPSPEPVKQVLSLYKTKKENAVMFGDNHTDILSAGGAGVKTCFCGYGYGTKGTSFPDFSIKSPGEIIPIIKSLI